MEFKRRVYPTFLFLTITILLILNCQSVIGDPGQKIATIKCSKDAYIYSTGVQSGTSTALFVEYRASPAVKAHSLLYFPINNYVPSGANIISAKLYLYKRVFDDLGSGKNYKTVYVYRVTEYWTENDVTWTKRTATKSWTTAGGSYTTEDGKWFNVKAADPWGHEYVIDITDIVKKWLSGTPNYGIILVPGTVWDGKITFHSRESSSNYIPKIKVTYEYYVDLAVTPSSQTVPQGGTVSFQLQITAGGNVGSVSLSLSGLPSGATYSFIPISGTPPFNSILKIQTSSSTPPGTYNIVVKAKGTDTSDTETVKLEVTSAGDFSIDLAMQSVTVAQGGTVEVSVLTSSSGGFNQPITLSALNLPSGVTAIFDPNPVSPGSTAKLTLKVSSTVPPGTYEIKIKGVSGDKTHDRTLTLKVVQVGFSITLMPAEVSVYQGTSVHITVTIAGIGGFAEQVELTITDAPSGVNWQFAPKKITPGSTSTLTLEVPAILEPGTYEIVVEGSGDGIANHTTLTLIVKELKINLEVAPNTLEIAQGDSERITIYLEAEGAPPSPIKLSATDIPSGVSVKFSSTTINPGEEVSVEITVESTATPGDYMITIQGATDDIKVVSTLKLTIIESFDFDVSVNPTSVEITQGESTTIIVTVSKLKGTSKTVKLSLLGLPSEASYSFNPPEVVPPASSTLEIDTGSAKGEYILVVVARSDSIEKTARVTLKIKEKKCFIATATYGSELSDEVNVLRRFRDEIVLSTYSGRRFYAVFNVFYYSWSPYVAKTISSNEFLRSFFRVLLYPLIYSLNIATTVAGPLIALSPELAVYVAGTLASIFIGLVYFTPLTILITILLGFKIDFGAIRLLLATLVGTIGLCILSLVFKLDMLLSASTFLYVVITAISTATLVAKRLQNPFRALANRILVVSRLN